MQNVKKLFFVPVGLPGMGKSTLAKHMKNATQKHIAAQSLDKGEILAQAALKSVEKISREGTTPISFAKVSYDGILGDNLNAYQKNHPETPFHEIIDIIRGQADQDYLEQIARHCIQDLNP